jgi:putative hydrolase of the HAD superfamily
MFTDSRWDGIEGIVFDAVGTLIEPTPPAAEVYLTAARRQGVELDRSEVNTRFLRQFRLDEADEARGPMVTDEANEYRRWRRIVTNVLVELPDPDEAFAELWSHFGRPGAWRCFPDVAPTLEAFLSARFPVRIASNFDARIRTVVAGLPALATYRDALLISSEVGYRKPHPRFYEAVIASLRSRPERILWIGDDAENDLRGARAAGMRSVLLDRAGANPDELSRLTDLLMLTSARSRAPSH